MSEQQDEASSPSQPTKQLLLQAPDYKLYSTTLCGRPAIIREWQAGSRMHPILGRKVTNNMAQQEAKAVVRMRKLGLHTPVLYLVEPSSSSITLQDLKCPSLQQQLQGCSAAQATDLLQALGKVVARLHDGGVIHGSLKPQHVLVANPNHAAAAAPATQPSTSQPAGQQPKPAAAAEGQPAQQQQQQQESALGGAQPSQDKPSSSRAGTVLVLSFAGYSFNSTQPQDKGADLHQLELALAAIQEPQQPNLFDAFMSTYKVASKQWSATFNRLAEVRKRHKGGTDKAADATAGPAAATAAAAAAAAAASKQGERPAAKVAAKP